jgi:hypothetical protein
MQIQKTFEGEWEVYIMGRCSIEGVEAPTIVLATFDTEEKAEFHIRVLQRNGAGDEANN